MTAVILVGDSIVTPVAGTVPMLTVVPVPKLVPTIVIAVPPNVLPDGGVMEEIPTADGAVGPLHRERSRAQDAEQSCKHSASHLEIISGAYGPVCRALWRSTTERG